MSRGEVRAASHVLQAYKSANQMLAMELKETLDIMRDLYTAGEDEGQAWEAFVGKLKEHRYDV